MRDQLKSYPLDAVYVNDDADVDKFLLDPAVDYSKRPPKPSVRRSSSSRIRYRAETSRASLVARLGAGIGADVTDFKIEGGMVECISPKFGGALDHDVRAQAGRLRHRDGSPERV